VPITHQTHRSRHRARSRRPLRLGRGTQALAGVALAATAATIAVEWARVWRRGSAPDPHREQDAHELLAAGRTATLETLEVFREGYRASPNRENALFNMLAAFATTFAVTRGTTLLIRSGRGRSVLRNLVIADRHIHHFVPGMILALAAGGTSIAVRQEGIDRWSALPFGAGAALVLDEAALLLELEDVYWSEEGVLSLQLSFAAIAGLAALALGVRLLRRGESTVLPPPPATPLYGAVSIRMAGDAAA
jgi:hypothetical protein